jgi:hypothetical protein
MSITIHRRISGITYSFVIEDHGTTLAGFPFDIVQMITHSVIWCHEPVTGGNLRFVVVNDIPFGWLQVRTLKVDMVSRGTRSGDMVPLTVTNDCKSCPASRPTLPDTEEKKMESNREVKSVICILVEPSQHRWASIQYTKWFE